MFPPPNPKLALLWMRRITWIILALALLRTVVCFIPTLFFLYSPLFVLMIFFGVLDLSVLFLLFRCPKCKKILNLRGDAQKICHHCGEKLP